MLNLRNKEKIELVFNTLDKHPEKIVIAKTNLERFKKNKVISPEYTDMWERLLQEKNIQQIKEMMLTDNDYGEILRSTTIFTRIV